MGVIQIRSTVQKFPAWPTFWGDRNKTALLFFNIVSLYFNTLFNWYIKLTIDGTTYPSQHFPFGAAFVCQAGNFWTLLHIYIHTYIHTHTQYLITCLTGWCPAPSPHILSLSPHMTGSIHTPSSGLPFFPSANQLNKQTLHIYTFLPHPFLLDDLTTEDEDTTFLRRVGNHKVGNTASHHSRP